MINHSPLLTSNPKLDLINGVYKDPSQQYRESSYSDKFRADVLTQFSRAQAKGLYAFDFEPLNMVDVDQSIIDSLDAAPYNFVSALNYQAVHTVLDLSEDLGGVAHYIADHVGPLDSIKLDPTLAQLSAVRCANKANVTHFSADLDSLSLPEGQYDLIVIGQLERLTLTDADLPEFLSKLRGALSTNGALLVNVANKAQLSTLLNRGDTALPYAQAYQSSADSEFIEDRSRKQLRTDLLNHDFAKVSFHVMFSRGNECDNLFFEDYLAAGVHKLNHFYRLGYLDNPELSEYLLFRRLVADKQDLVDLGSRFIAIAGVTSKAVRTLYSRDYSYFANQRRKPEWRVDSHRNRSATQVQRIARNVGSGRNGTLVSQQLAPISFCKGTLLATLWLDALHSDAPSALTSYIQQYYQWLEQRAEDDSFTDNYLAALPHSIVVHERTGAYHLIDNQWRFKQTLTPDFVLFRALLHFANDNICVLKQYALRHHLLTVADFIIDNMPGLNSHEDLQDFVSLEQSLQLEIMQRVDQSWVADFIDKRLDSHNTNGPSAKIDNQIATQAKQLRDSQQELAAKDQRIHDLQTHRDDLLSMVKKVEGRIEIERNLQGNLYLQIDSLEKQLHIQNERSSELHQHLLMRPSTRIKRVLRRNLDRLLGRQAPQPESLVHKAEEVKEVPFYELPEGEMIAMNTEDYGLWIQENSLSQRDIDRAKSEIEAMPYKPVFSILVPIYNTDPEYLIPMIESVKNQIYPHWQLCLVDDCSPKTYLKRILEQQALDDDRISIQLNDVNQGISVTTNDALAMAKGDYIALLDHDDEITIDALYENAKLINAQAEVGLIYSDEDKMELDGTRVDPYFKPDYSPDLLDTNNYICHFTVIKKSLMQDIGGFREGLDGSQDHDVILRAARAADKVAHIPRILYHWRKIPGSTAVEYDSKGYAWEAGRKAIEDLHRQYEDNVRVEFGTLKGSYRLRRAIVGEPLVSIVIPFKDKPELLDSCLTSILNRTSYRNFEVVGVSNNSEQALTQERMDHFSKVDSRIRFVEHNVPFNFSAICNYGVEQANGDYIVLLNNDIEIITPDWIESMLEHAQREQIGAVGCKLLFPDGLIQHAGVVAGMVGAAGHPHKFFPDSHIGYNGRLHMACNVSAVTGAMLMVSKAKYQEVNGLDAENLAVAYNDIDFCLKLINKGYLNVFTPYVSATHHESISRGYEDTDEKMQRLLKEQKHFLTTWDNFLQQGDPFYNRNMSLKNERFSMRFKD